MATLPHPAGSPPAGSPPAGSPAGSSPAGSSPAGSSPAGSLPAGSPREAALPHEPASPHEHRAIAESFGVDPARYDRARLGYPDALITRIIEAAPGRDVLDVGCGTGIVARQFQAAGCRVLGVEPDARMAAFARGIGVSGIGSATDTRMATSARSTEVSSHRSATDSGIGIGIGSNGGVSTADGRGVEVEVATFENWDPAGRLFDAVVAGTAWHWVDPARGAAKAAAILRPGGRIALFWHTFEMPQPVARALADVYRRVVPDSPISFHPSLQGVKLYQPGFTKAADGIRATDAFGPTEQWQFDWEHTYSRDAWLDQLPTTGGLTRLSAHQQAAILAETGAAIDAMGGSFSMPYATVAVTAEKISR